MMDQDKRAFVQQEISRWIVGQIERTDLSPEAHSILEQFTFLGDVTRTLQFLAQPSMESTILRDAIRNAAQFIALLQGVQDGVSDVFESLVPITNAQIRLLRAESMDAGDYDQVRLCDRALGLSVRVFSWEVKGGPGGYGLTYPMDQIEAKNVTINWERGEEDYTLIRPVRDGVVDFEGSEHQVDVALLSDVVVKTWNRDAARAACAKAIERGVFEPLVPITNDQISALLLEADKTGNQELWHDCKTALALVDYHIPETENLEEAFPEWRKHPSLGDVYASVRGCNPSERNSPKENWTLILRDVREARARCEKIIRKRL